MRHATVPDVVVKLMEGRARIANGWCQGERSVYRPERLGGPMYCALGAIGVDYDARRALRWALSPIASCSCIARYNDAPERTQADILALFDRAIEGVLDTPRKTTSYPFPDVNGAVEARWS